MSYSPELGRPELPGLGSVMKNVGAWALAGVLVAGGATIAAAYNDLKQGVKGPVFDISHAETHASDSQDTLFTTDLTDPTQFDSSQFYMG